jgi:hypothetical protein
MSEGTGGSGSRSFPWDGDPHAMECNFAFGHLVENVQRRLTIDNRIHAETYIAAVGAIAGFAAQCTLFDTLVPQMGVNINVVTTKSGDRYWFGDRLNEMLLPKSDQDAPTKVWSVAAGAALAAGLARENLPDLSKMFAHVSSTIGAENEGLPSVPRERQPHLRGRELLKAVWPLVLICFSGKFPGHDREYGAAPRSWWSAIAAQASARPVLAVKQVLAPDVALTILMETAIYTSKIDAASIGTA